MSSPWTEEEKSELVSDVEECVVDALVAIVSAGSNNCFADQLSPIETKLREVRLLIFDLKRKIQ